MPPLRQTDEARDRPEAETSYLRSLRRARHVYGRGRVYPTSSTKRRWTCSGACSRWSSAARTGSPVAGRADSRAASCAEFRIGTARLVEACVDCIEQCGDLLRHMPAAVFAGCDGGNSSIGAHVRHVVDRYQCFFNGLDSACIDYDDRRRGTAVETEVAAAAAAIAEARNRLAGLDPESRPGTVLVRELVHLQRRARQRRKHPRPRTHGLGHPQHSSPSPSSPCSPAARASPVPENLGKAPSTIAAE